MVWTYRNREWDGGCQWLKGGGNGEMLVKGHQLSVIRWLSSGDPTYGMVTTVNNTMCCAELLSHVQLFETPWTVACQAPLSMGILQARILAWIAIPSSRGSSQPGIKPRSPALQMDFLLSEPSRKLLCVNVLTILRRKWQLCEIIYYCKFRLKLKKVEKITRSFRFDLNQIPYDYTVEVTSRLRD